MKKYLSQSTVVILLVFGISIQDTTAQNRASDVIKLLQKRFETLSDFTADLLQVREFEFSGVVDSSFLKIALLKEDYFKIESSNIIFVTDGKTIEDYDILEKRMTIDEADENSRDSLLPRELLFEFPKRFSPVDYISEDRYGSSGFLISLEPKKPDEELMQILVVWFDSADSLVKYVRYVDIEDNKNVYVLSNYKIDTGLTPEDFKINPPEGTRIVDLRPKKD